jgi:predicted CoA-binding protein
MENNLIDSLFSSLSTIPGDGMSEDTTITAFLSASAFGVAGASTHREKYGNKVLRAYQQNHKTVYPVHPHETMIEGIACVAKIADLPMSVMSLSIITPPKVTETLVQEAITKGIKHIWMQPGAESEIAVEECIKHGINVIHGGACILVALRYHE